MAMFASSEWVESLGRATEAARVDPSLRITVEQRIEGDPPPAWHFVFADGRVRAGVGMLDAPTVTLTSSMATARAIHAGELSAQRAFLDGDLRIGGDLGALLTHRTTLAEVAAVVAAT